MRATSVITLVLLVLAAASASQVALAQQFPQRPVRFIVPYGPGGGADTLARLVTKGLGDSWDQPVVVDNRPGADATLGVDVASRAPADGHTLVLVITSHAVHPSLRKLPYDLLKDFSPISNVLQGPAILVVNPKLNVSSVKELIALAKSRAGKLNFAAPGIGGPGHLSGVMFNHLAGVKTVHVPYKGGAASLISVVAGETNFMFTTVLSGKPFIQSGRLKALAVTSAQRSPSYPELPTMIESGLKNFVSVTWYGILTRAGTPAPIVQKTYADIMAVVRKPDVSKTLISQGVEILGMNPAEFSVYLKSELKKWGEIVKQAGDLQAQ